MRSMISCAAVSFALVVGCGTSHPTDDNGQSSGETANGGGASEPGGGSGASCPLGAAAFEAAIPAAASITTNSMNALSLAIDLEGNAFVGAAGGMDAFSPLGALAFSLPAGSLVATDLQGNIFVAGSFSSRLDLGAGVMIPNGNIDVFVAKLDAHGKILFVKQLGLCGDGVASMAIDRNGRIAISGSAMGTVVLSASGDVMFQVEAFGHVAFDSAGNLLIAINNPDGSLALEKVDVAGNVMFQQMFAGTAVINGIAIDANDHILLVGQTTATIDFLGTSVTARSAGEAGRVTGAFLVELDTACNLVLVRDLGIVEANGVAVDAAGNIFVVGASTVNTFFFRAIAVLEIDARGVMSNIDLPLPVVNGRAFAVAVDACGSLFVALVRMDSRDLGAPLDPELVKLSL